MKRAFARGRVFPQSYSTDRRYGRLSLKACALFPLVWVNADDQGRLCGDPEEVKYACCPNIDHITKADVPQILAELEQNQLIKIYTTPKTAAIQILDWWNVQKPQWAWPSEYPPPDGWNDRLRYKKDAKTVVTENWPSGESRSDAQVKEEKTSGNDENSAQVRTETNDSGEDKNQVQVSETTPSGECPDMTHTSGKNCSPEALKQPQVNSPAFNASLKKVLAVCSYPPPDLLPSLETETETEKEYERGDRNRRSPEGSGESQNSSQVRTVTQAAKKPPDQLVKERNRVFAGLNERRGYSNPVAGADAKAINWMLRQGYQVEEILGAYDRLKQDQFWRDKLLNMQSVKAQIGEIFKGRRQHEQHEHREGRQPTGAYEWREAPGEPDDTS